MIMTSLTISKKNTDFNEEKEEKITFIQRR